MTSQGQERRAARAPGVDDGSPPHTGLLPCPFCGDGGTLVCVNGWWSVRCTGCQAGSSTYATGEELEAREIWNRRAAVNTHAEREDSLRNLLAVIHGDGGHYADEHGLTKAAADAEAKWYEREAELARLRADLGAMELGVETVKEWLAERTAQLAEAGCEVERLTEAHAERGRTLVERSEKLRVARETASALAAACKDALDYLESQHMSVTNEQWDDAEAESVAANLAVAIGAAEAVKSSREPRRDDDPVHDVPCGDGHGRFKCERPAGHYGWHGAASGPGGQTAWQHGDVPADIHDDTRPEVSPAGGGEVLP